MTLKVQETATIQHSMKNGKGAGITCTLVFTACGRHDTPTKAEVLSLACIADAIFTAKLKMGVVQPAWMQPGQSKGRDKPQGLEILTYWMGLDPPGQGKLSIFMSHGPCGCAVFLSRILPRTVD